MGLHRCCQHYCAFIGWLAGAGLLYLWPVAPRSGLDLALSIELAIVLAGLITPFVGGSFVLIQTCRQPTALGFLFGLVWFAAAVSFFWGAALAWGLGGV